MSLVIASWWDDESRARYEAIPGTLYEPDKENRVEVIYHDHPGSFGLQLKSGFYRDEKGRVIELANRPASSQECNAALARALGIEKRDVRPWLADYAEAE